MQALSVLSLSLDFLSVSASHEAWEGFDRSKIELCPFLNCYPVELTEYCCCSFFLAENTNQTAAVGYSGCRYEPDTPTIAAVV